MYKYKINYTDGVAVADDFHWLPIHTCPLNIKVLLLTTDGICIVSKYVTIGCATHWAPLPRKPKEAIE